MSDNSVKFGVDFDTKAASAAADELRKKLQALGDVKTKSNGLASTGAQLDALRTKLNAVQLKFNQTFGPALAKTLAVLRTALLAVAAAAAAAVAAIGVGIGAALRKGIGHNSELDDLQTGISATVSSLYELNDASGVPLQGMERFRAATEQAKQRLEEFRKETAQTGYAMKDRAAALDVGLSKGAAAGIDADAAQKLVADITKASTAVGVAGSDLVSEVNALLSGQGLNRSKLGDALAISPQVLQSWQKQGTLVKELNTRLTPLLDVAANAEKGMSQLQGILSDNVSKALEKASAGAYETVKRTLQDTLSKLFDKDGDIAPRYAALYDWAMRLFNVLAKAFENGVSFVLEKLGGISDWLARNKENLADVGASFDGIADSIARTLRPLSEVATGIDDATEGGQLLLAVFETVERVFAAISDLGKTAAGGISAVVGGVGMAVGDWGKTVGKGLGMDKLAEASERLEKSSSKMRENGKATFKEGLAFTATLATADAISERRAKRLVRSMQGYRYEAPQKTPKTGKVDSPANLSAKPVALSAADLEAEKKAAEALAAARLAAVRQAFADEQDLLRAELDKRVQLGITNKRQELAERQKLEADALAFETKTAAAAKSKVKAELAKTLDPVQAEALRAEIVKIDTQLATLANKGKVLKIKAELDKLALDKQIAEMAKSLNEQLRQLQGKPEDLAAGRIEALKNELVKVSPELQSLVNNVFDAKEANQRFEEAAAKVDAVHTKLALAEAAIERQAADATISMLDREKQLRDLRVESAEALKAATDEMKKAADATGNKQLVAQAQEAAGAVTELDHKTRELQQTTVVGLKSAFAGAFKDIATGAKSFSDGLLDLFTSLLSAIADKFAKQGFDQLFANAGGAKAGGGWLGGLMSIFGGAFANGGLIRGPGTGTSDQVPILASNGEFMMRAAVVKKHFSLLNYLNSTGNLPAMRATGGPIGQIPSAALGGGGGFGGTMQNNISVSPQVVIETGHVIDALSRDPRFEQVFVRMFNDNRGRLGQR
ncbi:hypothetical protein DZC30_02350 [Comamonas testosteroni]|uniref:Uncharacterized protein n=1 Tax=Comamonas testosteroni TaxID=285 RepID=A0A373FRZ3_COMTE|nr:hypothetical protein [Comamonas testosteroni]RGE46637.1 hypothetical protein DZC30_02350 [Comamonas testosteroni]